MAVKIRLRRTGAKGQPSYRLVVADSRSPRDGRFIEAIGHYNPRRHDADGNPELVIDPDRALHWLDCGAEPTETARSLLRRARILELRHDRNHGIDVSERLEAMRAKVRGTSAVAVASEPATVEAEPSAESQTEEAPAVTEVEAADDEA